MFNISATIKQLRRSHKETKMASNGWKSAGGKKARKAAAVEARLDRLLVPAEQSRHKIIVGVDYGTTFSGTLL
jgi:hypothetical protein